MTRRQWHSLPVATPSAKVTAQRRQAITWVRSRRAPVSRSKAWGGRTAFRMARAPLPSPLVSKGHGPRSPRRSVAGAHLLSYSTTRLKIVLSHHPPTRPTPRSQLSSAPVPPTVHSVGQRILREPAGLRLGADQESCRRHPLGPRRRSARRRRARRTRGRKAPCPGHVHL